MHNLSGLALLTDLYQITMGEAYFQSSKHEDIAVFHLFYRTAPFKGSYCISAGLADVIKVIQNFHFSNEDIEYLQTLTGSDNSTLFSTRFLTYLKELKITCDIDALEEGSIVFPKSPIIRVKGPLLQCQLIETILLNIVNFQTLIATKASRIKSACESDLLLEFGLRRAQGTNGALSASRASYIGGVDATSNVLAGKYYNIPVKGTHAHAWIMSFDDELEAFMSYAKTMPNNCILLVDTYDTLEGTKKAVKVAAYLKSIGHELLGIRLDSGDLTKLSIACRKILDSAGLTNVKIVASNDLDEYEITRLKNNGSKIDTWGVGTKLVTSFDQPALGGVFKLAALKEKGDLNYKYKIKLSNDPIKNSIPGVLQTRRFYKDSKVAFDVIFNIETDIDNIYEDLHSEDQLKPIFIEGKLIYNIPTLIESKNKANKSIKAFSNISHYEILLDSKIKKLTQEVSINAKGPL